MDGLGVSAPHAPILCGSLRQQNNLNYNRHTRSSYMQPCTIIVGQVDQGQGERLGVDDMWQIRLRG